MMITTLFEYRTTHNYSRGKIFHARDDKHGIPSEDAIDNPWDNSSGNPLGK